jgi:DNA-binding protein H-NS
MDQSDLAGKTAEELRALKLEADRLLKDKQEEERAALEDIAEETREKLKEAGLSLTAFIKTITPPRSKNDNSQPRIEGKFRNPDKNEETYKVSKQGRIPNWIKKAHERGMLDDLCVDDHDQQPA